ncbi:MAG: N-formylglutamate amidohydrolase [Rhodobacteraceae bacterium]|nr:N-formylglutamate amidohydrolase [Paracoccaceae bacterium]
MVSNTVSTSDSPPFALGEDDPEPVEVVNPSGSSQFVITCEHAGRTIPEHLGNLGIEDRHLSRHIAWDIGVDAVGRALVKTLDAPVIFQRYSRLVIDCNRPIWAEDSIPETSDGTKVPVNLALSDDERNARYEQIHKPFHDAVAGILDQRVSEKRQTALIALHSFTSCLEAKPAPRPWHLGILFNRDAGLSQLIHDAMEEEAGHMTFTFNEPYEVEDHGDYTIPIHGEQRGLPHSLLEIRNDHIAEVVGQREWADVLTRVLKRVGQRLETIQR